MGIFELDPREDEENDVLSQYLALNEPQVASPNLDPVPSMKAAPSMPELAPQPIESSAQPDVKDYIAQKYNLGKYSEENRQKLVDENKADESGPNWRAALAAIGSGLQGKDSAGAASNILKMQSDDRARKISDFDRGRDRLLGDIDADEKVARFDRENDLSSQESQLARDLAKRMAPNFDFSKLTAKQINDKIPSLTKIYDIEQRKLDRQDARQERRELFGLKSNEKKEVAAKLDDKQIAAFTDLDNAKSDLNNILSSVGDKSGWTGPLDGRVPDMLVGEDQVAWRSAVGKFKDAYRKAVTGAGASTMEIARLESRLPSESDTLENFKAKANEALKEIERRRGTMADNLKKGGKNVGQFEGSAPQRTVVKTQTNQKTGQKRIVYSDGTTEIEDSVAGN